MTVMLVGYDVDMVAEMRRSGVDVTVAFVKDDGIARGTVPGCVLAPVSSRFSSKPDGFDPEADAALIHSMFERHFPQFQRTHVREHFRQRRGSSSWLDPANHFQTAVGYYTKMLRKHAIEVVLFQFVPHEGSEIVLYHLAQALGLRTVIAFQTSFNQAFFLADSVERLGLDTTPGSGAQRVAIAPTPPTPFYIRRKTRFGRVDLAYRLALRAVNHAAKTATLSFWWNARAYHKSRFKAEDALSLYRNHNRPPAYYGKFEPDRSYVYFPLHVQPELATDVLGGRYADQLLAVEELARALPTGTTIYVKENPAQTTYMREESFFVRLRAIPTAVYLPAEVPTLQLGRHARFVATIVGTAGWEAAQMGKPVIVFGYAWYRGLPGVFDWCGPKTIADVDAFEFDAGRLQAAIDAKTATLWRGVTDGYFSQTVADFDVAANRRAVALAYRDYLAGGAVG